MNLGHIKEIFKKSCNTDIHAEKDEPGKLSPRQMLLGIVLLWFFNCSIPMINLPKTEENSLMLNIFYALIAVFLFCLFAEYHKKDEQTKNPKLVWFLGISVLAWGTYICYVHYDYITGHLYILGSFNIVSYR